MKTVIEMAHEAGLLPCEGIHPKDLEAFAALVREEEREACAKVCDNEYFAFVAADAIRARGQE